MTQSENVVLMMTDSFATDNDNISLGKTVGEYENLKLWLQMDGSLCLFWNTNKTQLLSNVKKASAND